jgi:hypothetical protein
MYDEVTTVMPKLQVEMMIPFEGSRGLIFHKWLPSEAEHNIVVTNGDLELILSFPLEVSWWASQKAKRPRKTYRD